MARINVEQQALTDPRFLHLGLILKSPRQLAHDAGLGIMIRVWNYLTENWSEEAGPRAYACPPDAIARLFEGRPNAFRIASAITESGLGEETEFGIRIRGTEGRIEWLNRRRDAARQNGRLGGRKPNSANPLSPALSPSPALEAQSGDSEVVGKAVLRGPSQKRKAAPCPYAKAAQTYAFESWERRHDTKPPWGSGEFAGLAQAARLLKTLEAFVRSWDRYLRSTDRSDMGHDPKWFRRHLSKWAAAPEMFRQDGSRVCTRCGSSERDVTILASGICEPCDRHEKRGLRSV